MESPFLTARSAPRRVVAAWILAVGLSASAGAADDNQAAARPLTPQVMVVKVDAQGGVTDVRYASEAPAAIRDLVVQSVRQWRFTPQQAEGHAVPWATQLVLWLVAEPSAGGFRLRVDRVQTQNLVVAHSGYPELPMSAARLFRRALVCADLTLDGSVDGHPRIAKLWVDEKEVGEDNPYMRSMRVSLPGWKLEPLRVDGVAYPSGAVRVTVDASSTGGDGASVLFALKCHSKPPTETGSFHLATAVLNTYLGELPAAAPTTSPGS